MWPVASSSTGAGSLLRGKTFSLLLHPPSAESLALSLRGEAESLTNHPELPQLDTISFNDFEGPHVVSLNDVEQPLHLSHTPPP